MRENAAGGAAMPITELNHYLLVAKNLELNFLGEVIDPRSWAGKGSSSAVALEHGRARRRN